MNHARSHPTHAPAVAQPALLLGRATDWALALALLLLPFELKTGVALPGLVVTNAELLISAALGLWLSLLASERRLPRVPRRLWLPMALFLGVLLLSALLAPQLKGAALKFSLRQVQGGLLGLCVAERLLLGGDRVARRFVAALLAGGGTSALLGLLEMSESPAVLGSLQLFKEKPTLMGGLLRLSATFAYANIAAMYFEALLPLALVWATLAAYPQGGGRGAGGRLARLLAPLLPAALFVATLATFSRASLVVALALVVLVPAAAWALAWGKGRAPMGFARRLGLLCGGLLALGGLLLVASPVMRLRLTAPDVSRWHDARYAPQPLPTLAPNEVVTSSVALTNSGRAAWRASGLRPFALSYHWLDAQTRRVVRYDGIRTPLPRPVEPGDSITLAPQVQAPARPGRYLLAWDLVQEGANWLSEQGTPVAEVQVEVSGTAPASAGARQIAPPPPSEAPSVPSALVVERPPPDRGPLWRAAITLWRERPLVGIGPDIFRHVYGPLLGLRSFDNRIHTNNLYIEILVGAGLLGLAAAGLLLGSVAVPAVRALPSGGSLWLLAGLGGLAAFLIHGLLDMFLEYTATYALLWILLGMTAAWSSAPRADEGANMSLM